MSTSACVLLLGLSLGAALGNIFWYRHCRDQMSAYYSVGATCAAIGIVIFCVFKVEILAAVMFTAAGAIGVRCVLTTLAEKVVARVRKSGTVAIVLSLVPVVLLTTLALIVAWEFGQESLGFVFAVTAGIWATTYLTHQGINYSEDRVT